MGESRFTFTAEVNFKKVGVHSTFCEAFVDFFHAVRAAVKEGISESALEGACYIEQRLNDGKLVNVWPFQAAKKKAICLGILTEDGKLV